MQANIQHVRSRRAGSRRAGQSAQEIMNSPHDYLNARRDEISKLQRQLMAAKPQTMSPLLRAESKDESIALVPGFDVDLREDIERARFRDGQAGSGYVVVMGKPFKSVAAATSSTFESTAPSAPRTTSPIRTTQSPDVIVTSPVCTESNPLEPLHADQLHATVKVPPLRISETIAGAANRAVVRRGSADDSMHCSVMEDDLNEMEQAASPLSPKVRVSMHPLDDVDDVSAADMNKTWFQGKPGTHPAEGEAEGKETDISSREGLLTDEPSGASLYKSWARSANNQGRAAYRGQNCN